MSPDSSSQQRLIRILFEHATEATVVVDDDGRLILANRAAREIRGVDVETLFRWAPDRPPELTSLRAQLRVGGRASCELDFTAPGSVPRRLSLEGRAHGPVYAITLRDVTEQARMKAELRHLRSLESMGFLAASLVHDFNNVLTAMVGSATLLANAAPEGRPAELAAEMVLAGERGKALVRRVLRVMRRVPETPERINATDALRELRTLLELVAGSTVNVRLELDPEAGDTRVDRAQFEHAMLNLVANARDAMPSGGDLTITTANVSIGPTEEGPGECMAGSSYVAITIRDTGVGMTEAVRERIFERFFTTKDASEAGAGLGLSSVHGFVTQSGGCITVRSRPGEGTTVLMYLPAIPAPASVALPPSAPAPTTGKETVVLIEQDDHVRFVVRAALGARGYFVVDAPTGDLALRQARLLAGPVDLVLADLSAPGMSGPDVAAALQHLGRAPRLLWMTGLTDGAIEAHGVRDQPLLRKAFTPAELARSVRAVLDGRSLGERDQEEEQEKEPRRASAR